MNAVTPTAFRLPSLGVTLWERASECCEPSTLSCELLFAFVLRRRGLHPSLWGSPPLRDSPFAVTTRNKKMAAASLGLHHFECAAFAKYCLWRLASEVSQFPSVLLTCAPKLSQHKVFVICRNAVWETIPSHCAARGF